ncbi:uncharacterized protein LY89DRAFT_748217 [Mollisia scopiformis]|uniref:Uncharacterized protein n=1 Tax=Mollisia scopiformis TaxID=149040 RepID=A0A194XA25_MOLSC|nr:uncharacterized protein LY89DRAFT_748217 [Mollisia scopiformis]KUJ17023.1 hypothetical protein LY89DRAFT_748217 [Mollisia scopiformis]
MSSPSQSLPQERPAKRRRVIHEQATSNRGSLSPIEQVAQVPSPYAIPTVQAEDKEVFHAPTKEEAEKAIENNLKRAAEHRAAENIRFDFYYEAFSQEITARGIDFARLRRDCPEDLDEQIDIGMMWSNFVFARLPWVKIKDSSMAEMRGRILGNLPRSMATITVSATFVDVNNEIIGAKIIGGVDEVFRSVPNYRPLADQIMDWDNELEAVHPAKPNQKSRHPMGDEFHQGEQDYRESINSPYGRQHFCIWCIKGQDKNPKWHANGLYNHVVSADRKGGRAGANKPREQKRWRNFYTKWSDQKLLVMIAAIAQASSMQDVEYGFIGPRYGNGVSVIDGVPIINDPVLAVSQEGFRLLHVPVNPWKLEKAVRKKKADIKALKKTGAHPGGLPAAESAAALLSYEYGKEELIRLRRDPTANPFLSEAAKKEIQGQAYRAPSRKARRATQSGSRKRQKTS